MLTNLMTESRIGKRSVDMQSYYRPDDDITDLETADNVVFQRISRDVDYNFENNEVDEDRGTYDLETNRVKRDAPLEVKDAAMEDLDYKQFIENSEIQDPTAQVVDLKSLERKNRPADVLEYKRFLKVSFEKHYDKLSEFIMSILSERATGR